MTLDADEAIAGTVPRDGDGPSIARSLAAPPGPPAGRLTRTDDERTLGSGRRSRARMRLLT